MKFKYYIIVACIVLAGCKIESARLAADLKGTWELTSVYGDWGGNHEYEPGNGNIIIFNGDTYYQEIKTTDTTYKLSGTFIIYTGKPCDFAREQKLITFDNSEYAGSFSLSGGKLTMGATECIADGSTSTYRKIE